MTNASQVTSYNPWGTASPYLTDILGHAQGLYNSQSPLYANPSGNFGFGQATGAVGNALGGNTTLGGMANQLSPIASGNISSQFANPFGTTGNLDATGAIRQQLSGTPDYSAVGNAIDAANTQQWNQLYNQVIPQLNQRASFLGNPSGAIKDLNSAVAQIGQNQSLNAQQAYLGQYNLAKQQQQQAAGLVANGGLQSQSNALGFGGLAGQLAQGQGSQALSAAQLYPGISSLPQQNLADYANVVNGTTGRFGSGTQTVNPGSFGTAANVIGGLTAGAGLYNTLFPNGGGGLGGSLLGGLGKLFGLGSTAANNGGYSSLNNFLNNGNSTSVIDQWGGNGIMANTPADLSGFTPDMQDVTFDPNQFDTGNINWGDPASFTSAGGQAAEPTASDFQSTDNSAVDAYQASQPADSAPSSGPSLGNAVGMGQSALGIYSGLNSGTPTGYAGAAISGASLANQAGIANIPGVGIAGAGLGLYSGIKQGGVAGGAQAAGSASMLASSGAQAAGYGGTAAGTALSNVANVAGPAAMFVPLAMGALGMSYGAPAPLDMSGNFTKAEADGMAAAGWVPDGNGGWVWPLGKPMPALYNQATNSPGFNWLYGSGSSVSEGGGHTQPVLK